MKISRTTCFMTCLLTIGFTSTVNAGMITQAVGVTTNMGTDSSTGISLENIINGNGLITPIVSGTDFDTYIGTDPQHKWEYSNTEWFSQNYTTDFSSPTAAIVTGYITFDLGQDYYIDQMAIWNEDSHGIRSFNISILTNNNTWVEVLGNQFASDTQEGKILDQDTYGADIYKFQSTLGSSIRIDVLSVWDNVPRAAIEGFYADGLTYASLGEVAFSTSPVPEPTTLLLFGTGLSGLLALRRRKR
jgi:hypothetical protein